MEKGIAKFFDQFASGMYYWDQYQLDDSTEDDVYNHFKHATKSAAAMDGWHPKGFSYLSREVCTRIAILFNQIEKGAPWPSSTRHARVVYFEKTGTILGEVMSYRQWASLRLRHMAPCGDK